MEKMGTLVVPLIHLKEAQSSGFFYAKGRENGRGWFYKDSEALSRISLMIKMFTAGTISLKAMGTTPAHTRRSQRD